MMTSLQPQFTPQPTSGSQIATIQQPLHVQLQTFRHLLLFTSPTHLCLQPNQTCLFSRTKMDKRSKIIQMMLIMAILFLHHQLLKRHHRQIIIPRWETKKLHVKSKHFYRLLRFHQHLPCRWPLDVIHLRATSVVKCHLRPLLRSATVRILHLNCPRLKKRSLVAG